MLDRSQKVLQDVDEAVSPTLAVGGELLTRITKLWEPMVGLLGPEADLQAARATGEELLAQTSPPLGNPRAAGDGRRRVVAARLVL